jgi:hypothetical protein
MRSTAFTLCCLPSCILSVAGADPRTLYTVNRISTRMPGAAFNYSAPCGLRRTDGSH